MVLTGDRKHEVQVVPLQSCTKDIVNHQATWSFSGPESEIELILSRAASARLFGFHDHMSTSSWQTWIGMDKGFYQIQNTR